MKLNKILILSLTTINCYAYENNQVRICNTRENVNINQKLNCVAPARSAGGTYFYITFNSLVKNFMYKCNFDSNPTYASLILNQSQFPEGTNYSFSNPNYKFPLSVDIDTSEMLVQESALTVKYIVGASDTPSNITAVCLQN